MRLTVSRAIVSAGFCLLGSSVPAAGQRLPEVRITAWEPSTNGTGVVFRPLNPAPVGDAMELPDQTRAGKFEYRIDTSDVRWADDCRCFRYIIVSVRTPSNGRISRHKFRAYPSGSFEDQRVAVRLTISDASASDDDEVSLPVASAPGLEPGPLVKVELREPLGYVSLGGAAEIQIVLRNPNRSMSVLVPSDIEVSSDRNKLWKGVPVVVGPAYPITLAPGATQTVRVRVEPDAWEAIQTSIIPTSSDKPHTALRIKVPYANALFQQRAGVVEMELPVRFRPSIFSLGSALGIGVLLGSLVLLISRKVLPVSRWSRAALTALIVAIVLELVGIFMVANSSKFVIFNFDLDPWQTLPVMLLGVATGLLGFEAAKLLRVLKEEAKQ